MYYIIGDDQKEYGPVSVEQVRQWIAEGRANRNTNARTAASESWRSLSEFPELIDSFKWSTTGPPIPRLHSPPRGTASKTSELAVPSLVLVIFVVCTCGFTPL